VQHDAIIAKVAREFRHTFPKAEFDDLFQEGRLAVWKRKAALDILGDTHARKSAAQTANWAMIDYVRRMWPARGKAKQLIVASVDDFENFELEGPDDTFGNALVNEFCEKFPKAYSSPVRTILELLAHGYTPHEVANQLGVSYATVWYHQDSIRERAKKFLNLL